MKWDTPCLLINDEIMKRNIHNMARDIKEKGCQLRPHTKTHKMPEIAKLQIEAGAAGITVAKVGEAEIMVEKGINDIFIAYPIIGDNKIKRILEINKNIRLIVGVDSIEGAKALSMAALLGEQTLEVRLEVDTGLKRTGVYYDDAVRVAKEINSYPGLKLTGIFTFKGLIYKGEPTLDAKKAGLEEGEMMVSLAESMRNEGIHIKDVSVGSTPTASWAATVPGVTEVRPGTYVFNDTMLANMGICSMEDCALKVLVTVVSRPTADRAIVDGGSKTFSTDIVLNTFPHHLKGYGRVIEGPDDFILERLSEEHGIVTITNDAAHGATNSKDILPIGAHLSIIPNHVCTTLNLHDKAYIIKHDEMVNELRIQARGKVY